MGISQRNKGKRGERELAKAITEHWGHVCRRGQQYCGADGSADVVGLPGVHIECKRVERLNVHAALEQAISDANDDDVPIVCSRKNGGEWLVHVRLADVYALAAIIADGSY